MVVKAKHDEYSIVFSEMDLEGMRSITVIFKPDVKHESLLWKLATAMFGRGNWHVVSHTTHTPWNIGPGPACVEYEVHRGGSKS